MASKYFFVILVFSAVPFAQSTAVKKRGIESTPFIGPILQGAVNQVTNVTNGIMSLLGVGVTQAQSLVQNYTAQATAVNAAVQGPLESLLQTAVNKTGEIVGNELQYKWNRTLCAVGQKENATSVVHQAGCPRGQRAEARRDIGHDQRNRWSSCSNTATNPSSHNSRAEYDAGTAEPDVYCDS